MMLGLTAVLRLFFYPTYSRSSFNFIFASALPHRTLAATSDMFSLSATSENFSSSRNRRARISLSRTGSLFSAFLTVTALSFCSSNACWSGSWSTISTSSID